MEALILLFGTKRSKALFFLSCLYGSIKHDFVYLINSPIFTNKLCRQMLTYEQLKAHMLYKYVYCTYWKKSTFKYGGFVSSDTINLLDNRIIVNRTFLAGNFIPIGRYRFEKWFQLIWKPHIHIYVCILNKLWLADELRYFRKKQ